MTISEIHDKLQFVALKDNKVINSFEFTNVRKKEAYNNFKNTLEANSTLYDKIIFGDEAKIEIWHVELNKMKPRNKEIIEIVYPIILVESIESAQLKLKHSVKTLFNKAKTEIINAGFRENCLKCNGSGYGINKTQKCSRCLGSKYKLLKLNKTTKKKIKAHFNS